MSKRRFFQMHLSTAVVLMLVAGVLVWANVRQQGYPFIAVDEDRKIHSVHGSFTDEELGEIHKKMRAEIPSKYIPVAIAVDFFLTAFVLCVVWQVCEWRIRRSSQTSP